jgi:hypothetical protein
MKRKRDQRNQWSSIGVEHCHMKWEPNHGINGDVRNTYYETVTIIPRNEIVGSVQNKDNIKFWGGILDCCF